MTCAKCGTPCENETFNMSMEGPSCDRCFDEGALRLGVRTAAQWRLDLAECQSIPGSEQGPLALELPPVDQRIHPRALTRPLERRHGMI